MIWEMNILFFYYFVIVCVSFILFYMSVMVKKYFFSKYNIYMDSYEKNLAFECGFNPFDDASNSFEVSFYLVAILFMIFDLEIIFLFPWMVSLNYVGIFGFWVMVMFLFMLTVGFVFEWMKGALDWY